MGYTISTLKSLPNHFKYFFFMIGDYSINDRVTNFFREDFDKIAHKIGVDTAIVKSSGREQYEKELINALLHVKNKKIQKLISDFERNDPGLLILNCHPNDVNDKAVIIYVPIRNLENLYSTNVELYRDLINLSSNRDTILLKKIKTQEKPWKKILGKLELKPNFYGIGININKIIGTE